MGDACANPDNAEDVYKMLLKNFERHYNSNRAPFGLFYHAAWFTTQHYRKGYMKFIDYINSKDDVYMVTNWQVRFVGRRVKLIAKFQLIEVCG